MSRQSVWYLGCLGVSFLMLFAMGCKKEKKESTPELQTREFMVGPKTLKMDLVPRMRPASCSGCAVFEGAGYSAYIVQAGSTNEAKSLEQAIERYKEELFNKDAAPTGKALDEGFLVSGPELVMHWRKVDRYSPILCKIKATNGGSKERQAMMEKMCLSMFNPYDKKKKK